MTTQFEDIIRQNSQRLADLKKTTEELERELSEARVSLERQLEHASRRHNALADQIPVYPGPADDPMARQSGIPVPPHPVRRHPPQSYRAPSRPVPPDPMPPDPVQQGPAQPEPAQPEPVRSHYRRPNPAHSHPSPALYEMDSLPYYSADEPPFAGEGPRFDTGFLDDEPGGPDVLPDDEIHTSDPTLGIASHGRQSAYRRRLSRRSALAIAGAAAVLATVLAVIMASGGASWPASVATVQADISRACENPDVVSEPGQVNFACAKATRQILWVFALLTSNDNPNFADTRTGRQGLEPITPSQGGAVAASLNLHHPYDPANPIDSIAVAARAINDIIGGATVTGTKGNPVVQPGLESDSGKCLRYTGSGLVTSRQGFPDLCARPVTTAQGRASLVADVYREWIVGASAGAAHDAAVLFTNADNPGDPQVQAILRQLGNGTLAA